MRTQTSLIFTLSAFTGLAKAGWDPPTANLSYDTLCSLSFNPPSTKHICFDGPEDVSTVFTDTTFHGFVQPGSKTKFVLYENETGTPFYYQSDKFMISIQWNVTPPPGDKKDYNRCAAYYVQSVVDGRDAGSGIWCPDKAPVSLGN